MTLYRSSDQDQDHSQQKEIQKGKMVVWGGLTNSWEKKRSKRQSRKGKIYRSEKAGLKLNIQKIIRVSSPITSWQIDGESMETVTDFIFLGSEITADGDCSHEIKKDTCSLEEKQWQT